MEKVINAVLRSVVRETGKIIGISLAVRLGMDELERTRALNREIIGFRAGNSGISVSLKGGTPRKRMAVILEEIVESLTRAYRGIIGEVAVTLARNSLKAAVRRHGSEYPELSKIAGKLSSSSMS